MSVEQQQKREYEHRIARLERSLAFYMAMYAAVLDKLNRLHRWIGWPEDVYVAPPLDHSSWVERPKEWADYGMHAVPDLVRRLGECEQALVHYSGGASEYLARYRHVLIRGPNEDSSAAFREHMERKRQNPGMRAPTVHIHKKKPGTDESECGAILMADTSLSTSAVTPTTLPAEQQAVRGEEPSR